MLIYNNSMTHTTTDITHFDIRNVFGCFPHEELLIKLSNFGITGTLLWPSQRLPNRQCHLASIDDVYFLLHHWHQNAASTSLKHPVTITYLNKHSSVILLTTGTLVLTALATLHGPTITTLSYYTHLLYPTSYFTSSSRSQQTYLLYILALTDQTYLLQPSLAPTAA